MLKRVSSSLFQAPTGSKVQIVARSRDNNGVQDATFQYAQTDLPAETINGMPGCSIKLLSGRRAFIATVLFSNAPAPTVVSGAYVFRMIRGKDE